MIVADCAQDEAGTGPVQEQPDTNDERHRKVNERVLAEQDAADARDRSNRKIDMRRRHDLLADEAGADQAGETDTEDGQRQSGRDLVDSKSER